MNRNILELKLIRNNITNESGEVVKAKALNEDDIRCGQYYCTMVFQKVFQKYWPISISDSIVVGSC